MNEQHLLDEIRFDIEQKDLIKAKLVLSALGDVGPRTQSAVLSELATGDGDFIIALLADVIRNDPDLTKAFPGLNDILFAKVSSNPGRLLELLDSDAPSIDKVFLASAAAEIRLEKAGPALHRLLTETTDPKDVACILDSLGTVGYSEAIGSISEYLYSGDRDLVVAAIRALGEIGTAKALEKLSQRIGGDSDIDDLILDVLSKSQCPEAVELLNDLLKSEDVHVRTASKQRLGAVGSTAIRILAKNLTSTNVDLVIHSLNVMGDTGDIAAVTPVRRLLSSHPADPNVRFAAYETLGRLPLDKGVYTLAAGLEDPVENVRSAAARAIDRNYTAVLGAGIGNMLKVEDTEAMKIVAAVIDSESDNLFCGLMDTERFRELALPYLTKSRPDIRSHFADVLSRGEYRYLVKEIVEDVVSEVRAMPKVFAVDDSRMILRIYRKVLHNLGCDAQVFEFPAGALARLARDVPDLILTDLNMPDINGIELTERIRKQFTKEQLPIVMVTTQSEGKDSEAAFASGINAVVQKPFTEASIGGALSPFLGKLPRQK